MNYKTRMLNWSSAAIITAVFLISSASAQKAPQRVYFARGATEARVTGYLRGIRDEAVFVLRAKAGQHMRVDIRGRGATRGMVMFPKRPAGWRAWRRGLRWNSARRRRLSHQGYRKQHGQCLERQLHLDY